MKELTPEQLELIKKPLPKEAVKDHPTKRGMSTIQVIYVTERLNEVFGVGVWELYTAPIEGITPITKTRKTSNAGREYDEYTAVLKTTFAVPSYDIYYESIASSTNEDVGDACKGAKTDALTEIAGKFLGIGAHVWRNEKSNVTYADNEQVVHSDEEPTSRSCPKCQKPMKLVPGGVSKSTGKPYKAFYSCTKECNTTIRS